MPIARRPKSAARQRDQAQLLDLCKSLLDSGSRLEDRYWEQKLEQFLIKRLSAQQDDLIEATLNHLVIEQPALADLLLEQLQATSEACTLTQDGSAWDVLLLTAPLAVWTRYHVPSTKLTTTLQKNLVQGLQNTVLVPTAKVLLCPRLFSLDEMPRSFSEVWRWLQKLSTRLLTGDGALPTAPQTEPLPYILADNRHLIMAVAVPAGEAIFRWQTDEQRDKAACLQAWQGYCHSLFSKLLTGCQFEILLPQAYHYSVQDSEKLIRPITIRASCQWLKEALGLKPNELKATIAAVGSHNIEEYRVGYQRSGNQDVIYGTIWPVFESGDQDTPVALVDTIDEISAILKESGVGDIKRIPGILAPEQCEDCGAPLFPDSTGELVHAELPEEAFDTPSHFH